MLSFQVMRRHGRRMLAAMAIVFVVTASANAGGFLWMGQAGGTSINRFNLSTNMVDLTVTPGFSGGGTNNLAYDGTTLYAGTSATDTVMHLDPYSGAMQSATTFYNPSAVALGGGASLYDGAYNPSSGLWRTVYFSSTVFNCDAAGNIATVFNVAGAYDILGLEWVGSTLYATRINNKQFGTITFTGPNSAQFNQIPLTGLDPTHAPAALAYDQQAGILYMTAFGGGTNLYQVDPINGTATLQQLVVGANDAGSMGWVPIPEPSSLGLLLVGIACTLRRRRAVRGSPAAN